MQSKKLLSFLPASVMALSPFACNSNAGEEVISETDSQVSEEVSEDTSDSNVIEGFGNNLVDGTNVIDDHFDDNTKGAWGVYSNGGKFDLYAENGELVVDITYAGSMEHAVQIFRDGYCLNMGCVYTVSFDIYSDIERDIEWRFQINGGDHHAYYMENEKRIGPDKQTITAEFTMGEASVPAPRLCFNLGEQGDLDASVAHKVYIDNFVLTIKDASNAMALEPLPTPVPVKVNQIGYKPDDEKILICKYNPEVTDYTIVDANNNVVYSGKLSTDFANSKSGDGAQVKGDFSVLTTPGTYKVVVDGIGESYEFTIGDDIYNDIYKDVVRMLYLQRCGCVLDESLAGDFAHDACHMQETKVYETVDAMSETSPLYVAPISPTATGDFAAVMAKASVIYAEFDAEFAAACKEAAVKAYDYLIKNEETLTGFVNPEEIVTGEYPDGIMQKQYYQAPQAVCVM